MIAGFIVTLVFALPLLMAAYTDFNEMKIPNTVTLAMLAGFFLTLPLTWAGLGWFGEHMAVGGIFFLAGFSMFALGWLGGGDAKLMAAIGLWMGWNDALPFVIYTTLFGAALGLFLLLTPKLLPISLRTSALGAKLYQGGKDMPYGLALAAGAFFVWPSSQIGMAILG